jgi:hypothetical protein
MKMELKRIEPLRAANIAALVQGLLMCVFALLFFPFFLLMAIFMPEGEGGVFGIVFGFVMLIVYPIMGVILGWITGLVGSAIYNFIIRLSGGLLLHFDDVTSPMNEGA